MIVLDTNILISALIKDSLTRKIIIESGLDFVYPEVSLQEIIKYKEYIAKKGGYSEKTFETILNTLLDYITLVPFALIEPAIKKAQDIMAPIDIHDTVFLATALALNAAMIWSDDKDFERQTAVKIVKTLDMVRLFEK